MELKTRRRLFYLSVAIFVVVTPIILLYAAGYRLGEDWSLSKTGGIYIHSPLSGSEIYINNALEKTTNLLQSGVFISNLKPGSYEMLVAKEDYWPWQKKLAVRSELVTEANAFLIPRTPEGSVLMRGRFSSLYASPLNNILLIEEDRGAKKYIVFYNPNNKEFLNNNSTSTTKILSTYQKIENIYWDDGTAYIKAVKDIKVTFDFARNTANATYAAIPESLQDEEKTLGISPRFIKYDPRERIRLTALGNAVYAEWLPANLPLPYFLQKIKEQIVVATSEIRAIAFYPNRHDLIIYASANGVFVSEIDGRDKRNAQPIYKGSNPTFVAFAGEYKIYVLDNEVLMAIDLP